MCKVVGDHLLTGNKSVFYVDTAQHLCLKKMMLLMTFT